MLAAGGCSVVALCAPDTSLAHSWFVSRHVPIGYDEEHAVEALRAETSREHYDLVVIADEAFLHALGSRLQPWMENVLPFAADPASCARILDKNQMLRAIEGQGVAIPPSVTVSSADELPQAAQRVGYPLLIKDAVGCGGSGIRRVDQPDGLAAALASLAPAGGVTVQRMLKARSGCTDVVFDRGRARCWTSAYMLDQWPTPFEAATVRQPVAVPGLEAMLDAVGAATKYHGLGGIDWVEDETGARYFLEFNARVTHVIGPARSEFGRELGAMLRGVPPAPHEVVLPEHPIPIFPVHFVRALKSRPLDLLLWLPGRASSADIDWRDLGVIGSEVGAVAAGAIRRLRAALF
jgi:glutathione synthase/RimK-type ligase-like ATP-grasp enzyme